MTDNFDELPPVDPDVFDAAVLLTQRRLDTYEACRAECGRAEATFAPLTCGQEALYEVPDDEEGGSWLVEEPCGLPLGHSGDHGPTDENRTEPADYAAAAGEFRRAVEEEGDARSAWLDARDDQEALECHAQGEVGWNCVLRRGHQGEHRHPTTINLAG